MFAASGVPLLVLMVASFTVEACIWNGERSLNEVDGGDGSGGVAVTGMGGDRGVGGSPGIGGSLTGAGGSGSGGATGDGGSSGLDAGSGGSGAGGSGQGGRIDASQPDTGTADLTSPGDATSPPLNCGPTGATTRIWSFDTDVNGWDLSDGTTMIWTSAVGNPAPGALQVDWTGAAPIHPRRVETLGDLRGRILSARVWVDPGAAVGIKVFAQTGVRYWWADGGQVTPPAGQWTCVTLDIDNPAYSRIQYDPTDVQVLGLELQTGGSGRVYIDQVEY